MGANDKTTGKSADQRRDDFAKKNAAWNRRVKNAVSDLGKVADRAKQAAGSNRRRPV
jgi:thiamine pyrophosphate-dependent acetolactate synthase large subunit-like protein